MFMTTVYVAAENVINFNIQGNSEHVHYVYDYFVLYSSVIDCRMTVVYLNVVFMTAVYLAVLSELCKTEFIRLQLSRLL